MVISQLLLLVHTSVPKVHTHWENNRTKHQQRNVPFLGNVCRVPQLIFGDVDPIEIIVFVHVCRAVCWPFVGAGLCHHCFIGLAQMPEFTLYTVVQYCRGCEYDVG